MALLKKVTRRVEFAIETNSDLGLKHAKLEAILGNELYNLIYVLVIKGGLDCMWHNVFSRVRRYVAICSHILGVLVLRLIPTAAQAFFSARCAYIIAR